MQGHTSGWSPLRVPPGSTRGVPPQRGREKSPPSLARPAPQETRGLQEAGEHREGDEDLETQLHLQLPGPLQRSSGDPCAVGSISQLRGGQGHGAPVPPVAQHHLPLLSRSPQEKTTHGSAAARAHSCQRSLPAQGCRPPPTPIPGPQKQPGPARKDAATTDRCLPARLGKNLRAGGCHTCASTFQAQATWQLPRQARAHR